MMPFIKLLTRILLLLVLVFIVQPVVQFIQVILEIILVIYAFATDAGYRARINWPTEKELREFLNL